MSSGDADREEPQGLSAVGRMAIGAARRPRRGRRPARLVMGGDDYRVKARFQTASQHGQGQPGQERRPRRRHGRVDRAHAATARPSSSSSSTTASRRCARAPQATLRARRRSRASPTATSTCGSRPSGRRARGTIPDGGVIAGDRHDLGRRHRPALLALRRATPARACATSSAASATSYAGARRGSTTPAGSTSTRRCVAAQRLFDELNRDTPLLERFVVASSRS